MRILRFEIGAALSQIFPLLPDLEKADLCGCGFSNDETAALQDAYPDAKLVYCGEGSIDQGGRKLLSCS